MADKNNSDLAFFKEAKNLSIANFKSISKLNESLLNLSKSLTEYNATTDFFGEYQDMINSTNEKCERIIGILERKKMKCAFFGRTSNGKSSVINSMLGQKILPYGIGHTTSCFVQIQGTSATDGFIVKNKNKMSDLNNCKMDDGTQIENLPIHSVMDLSHALSTDKVSSESLILLYWPHQNCELLKAEVTLLDSPGVDIDPDLDYWINHNCLDADVFVLVANAESTLTQTEKAFFHKVKNKLSKPNIFILNNRWDACDDEDDIVAAKKQHQQRCIDFLTKELQVCTYEEACERIFFVSAKEMLEFRTNENIYRNNNLSARVLDRYENFLEFERSLEKNLCASALKTKFASHSLQGLELIDMMLNILHKLSGQIQLNLNDTVDKKLKECHIREKIKNGNSKVNDNIVKQISAVLDNIILKTTESLRVEIKHLNYIVKNFTSPFDPDPAHMHIYKTELNNHVEKQMNNRISNFCAGAIRYEIMMYRKYLIDQYTKLLGYDIDKSMIDIIERTSEHDLSIPCNTIFSNFKEDLSFQWPLNPHSVFSNALLLSYEARNSMNNPDNDSQSLRRRLNVMRPFFSSFKDIFVNKEFVGFCFISALICKVTGFRVITSSLCSYGFLYLYERIRWSRSIQENNFKNQYVKYASNQLTNVIDVCTRNYSCVIKQDLLMGHKSMGFFIDGELGRYDNEIRKYESEIIYLTDVLKSTDSANSVGLEIKRNLVQFQEKYL